MYVSSQLVVQASFGAFLSVWRTNSIIVADPLPLGVRPTMLDLRKAAFEFLTYLCPRSGLVRMMLESDDGYGTAHCSLLRLADRARDET